jgi:hypothetical protein
MYFSVDIKLGTARSYAEGIQQNNKVSCCQHKLKIGIDVIEQSVK